MLDTRNSELQVADCLSALWGEKKKSKHNDFSATVCKYFPSLIYLPVFNPLVLLE